MIIIYSGFKTTGHNNGEFCVTGRFYINHIEIGLDGSAVIYCRSILRAAKDTIIGKKLNGEDNPITKFYGQVDLPKNIEGYYQETGRAGRDGLNSDAILFFGAGDVIKLKSFAQVEGNEVQTKILLKKLDQMVQFCETKRCRRKYLLNYFGEPAVDNCASCDICLGHRTLEDATVISQKFLSAVVRLNEKFGAGYIIDVLRGSNSEKIRDEHKRLG